MSESVLDICKLRVEFTADEDIIVAVKDLNFQLRKGEKLGIVGESGSGKSVTSLAIMGLIPSSGKITQGEIALFEEENKPPVNLLKLKEKKRRKYRGGKIAMIFQEPMSALNPLYSIGFQLTEAILLHQNISPIEAEAKAISLLQEVKLLSIEKGLDIDRTNKEFLKRYPHQLSGGQLQRVTIAMAISCNPRVLIADEPTTALDVTVQAVILDLLRELCSKRGMSLIFITHDLGVIAELVDRVVVMYRGKVVETGDIRSIFTNPNHPYTKGLLACRPRLDRKLQVLPTVADFMDVTKEDNGEIIITEKETDFDSLSSAIITEEEQSTRLSQLLKKKPLLEIKNLKVGFPVRGIFGNTEDYFMAVNDVSFDVYPGETLGLVGESGCGKSTLAKTIIRLISPLSGKIIFNNRNILTYSDRQLTDFRKNVQIIFQNPYNSLNPRLTIGKAILEPLELHKNKFNKERKKERVEYLLDKVGLNPSWKNRYPHEFSGGQRQRVCIARALALQPQFIVCDESVSALDVSVQAQVLNLLKDLQKEFGLTYIFISHDLSVVKFMSDRIVVMNKGKVEEIDKAEDIYRNPKSEYTRQLINSIPTGKFS